MGVDIDINAAPGIYRSGHRASRVCCPVCGMDPMAI